MVKKYNRINGAVLSSKIIGLISETPKTINELRKEVYKDDSFKNKSSRIGRIYCIIETLVETGMVIPKIKNNKLKFGLKK